MSLGEHSCPYITLNHHNQTPRTITLILTFYTKRLRHRKGEALVRSHTARTLQQPEQPSSLIPDEKPPQVGKLCSEGQIPSADGFVMAGLVRILFTKKKKIKSRMFCDMLKIT